MMLQDKVAVIYGAGGAVGGAVARAFAADGASVFLTGRTLATVEAVAEDIAAAGESAAAAEVDALDEQAIDQHLRSVTAAAGRVMKLGELASVAAFVASDPASGLTGTTVSLTMGNLDD